MLERNQQRVDINQMNVMPVELLFEFTSYLPPQDLAIFLFCMGRSPQLMALEWAARTYRLKFQQHFPEIFGRFPLEEQQGDSKLITVDWQKRFHDADKQQYEYLNPRAKQLVSLIKQGDLQGLKEAKLTFKDLLEVRDEKHRRLTQLASSFNQQYLLDYFYAELVVPHYHHSQQNQPDMSVLDSQGGTRLHWAVQCGQTVNTVLALCMAGAEVNKADQSGVTPLLVAVQNGHIEMVKLLLESGAEVNKANQSGVTPLLVAVQNGHIEMVKLLLESGAEVNQADQYDRTPLCIAARNGHIEVVKLLLENDAEVDKADDDGTPLFIAARYGHIEVVKQLSANGVEVNQANQYGLTLLHIAARNGRLKVVEWLLANGAEVGKVDLIGRTPLFIAAQYGHIEVVKLLSANGAEVGKGDRYGNMPLFVAAEYGHPKVVEWLLANGAEVGKVDESGRTPLFIAAQNGHIEVVKLLYNRLLVDYADKLNANPAYYKRSIHFSIFNTTINFGFSAGEKRGAVAALQAVISGDMPPSSLQPHAKALESGELGKIFQAIRGAYPEIDFDAKPPKNARARH